MSPHTFWRMLQGSITTLPSTTYPGRSGSGGWRWAQHRGQLHRILAFASRSPWVYSEGRCPNTAQHSLAPPLRNELHVEKLWTPHPSSRNCVWFRALGGSADTTFPPTEPVNWRGHRRSRMQRRTWSAPARSLEVARPRQEYMRR